jgi:hypothetical protein
MSPSRQSPPLRPSRASPAVSTNSAHRAVASESIHHHPVCPNPLIIGRKIAWSKNGSLAYISPDGYSVHLKIFSRDTATGKWGLGKDVPVQVPQGRDNFPFVHLSWNSLGNDLAITDAAGRIIIFSCAIALDRMQFVRAELAHPEAEADGVVGVHWLAIYPHEAKVSHLLCQPASRTKITTEPHCLVSRP